MNHTLSGTDLPTRCRTIVRTISQQQDKLIFGLSPQALAILSEHPCSGDLGELEAILRIAVHNCKGRVILPAHLAFEQPNAPRPSPIVTEQDGGGIHKSTSPQAHRWESIGHGDGSVVQPPVMSSKATELPISTAPSFVDLGLLSSRNHAEIEHGPDDAIHVPAFRILKRRRVLVPASRRVELTNYPTELINASYTETSTPELPSPTPMDQVVQPVPQLPSEPTIRPLTESLEELERQLITQALHAANQNLNQAAELLCIPRQTLQYRMKALGVSL